MGAKKYILESFWRFFIFFVLFAWLETACMVNSKQHNLPKLVAESISITNLIDVNSHNLNFLYFPCMFDSSVFKLVSTKCAWKSSYMQDGSFFLLFSFSTIFFGDKIPWRCVGHESKSGISLEIILFFLFFPTLFQEELSLLHLQLLLFWCDKSCDISHQLGNPPILFYAFLV